MGIAAGLPIGETVPQASNEAGAETFRAGR
jgi:hypothetical protein